jgi:hypothetical protein
MDLVKPPHLIERLGSSFCALHHGLCANQPTDLPPTRVAIEAGVHSIWISERLRIASHIAQ